MAQRFQRCDKVPNIESPRGANPSSNNLLYDNHVPAFLCQSRILIVVLLFSVFTFGQQSGESSSRAHSKPTQQSKTESNLGALADGIYRNAFFGFTYKLPYGWVDRTADMREGDDPGKLLLLAVFERPPEATGSTINSAAVIAAEKVSSFSGLNLEKGYGVSFTFIGGSEDEIEELIEKLSFSGGKQPQSR